MGPGVSTGLGADGHHPGQAHHAGARVITGPLGEEGGGEVGGEGLV